MERYRKLVRVLSVHVLFPEAKADVRDEVWEKANEWMLNTALSEGGSRMTLIVLWDGEGGDGPGGTRHMTKTVEQHGGIVIVIDIGAL